MKVITQVIGQVEQIAATPGPEPQRYATLRLGDGIDFAYQTLTINCTYFGDDIEVGTVARVTVAWGESTFDLSQAVVPRVHLVADEENR